MVIMYLRRRRAAAADGDEQCLSPDGATPAQQARPETPRPVEASAAASAGGADVPARGGGSTPRSNSGQDGQAAKPGQGAHPARPGDPLRVLARPGHPVASLALSVPPARTYSSLGYVAAIVYAVRGPRRHNRPWRELGLKRGFTTDLGRVWYLVAVVAVLFQVLPPNFGIAYVLGYYPQLVRHVTARLPVNLGSAEGIAAIAGLLAVTLVLTLLEELVFRVTIQERLSWFIGTPAAIVVASVLFASAHAVGTPGSVPVILTDAAGVAIDGIVFGIIYAKTHNLVLTWATHYAADVVAIIALLLIFRS